jgi:hypothetical protein
VDKDYYITPEEYEEAERNGISKELLENRIRNMYWDKRRAITQPKRPRNIILTKEQCKTARENGISSKLIYSRTKQLNWSIEKAITTPIATKTEVLRNLALKRQKHSNKYLEIAIKNGIAPQLFRNRIYFGWSEEDAATIKPIPRSQCRYGRKKVIENAKENPR